MFPGYPDGVEAILLLRDLRFVKLPASSRARVLALLEAYKSRALTLSEDGWIRGECRKNRLKIEELHKSQDAVRITNAQLRVGGRKFAELQRLARKASDARDEERLRRLEELEREVAEERENLGI
jgi:hypothetical protein